VGAGRVTQNGPAPNTRQAKAPSCYSDSPCRNVALVPPTARLPKMREFSMSMLCCEIRTRSAHGHNSLAQMIAISPNL
jgi:hypothetical protein